MVEESDVWMTLGALDAELMQTVAGQEEQMIGPMETRRRLIAALEPQQLTRQQWSVLQDRTWSLQSKLAHWRRLLMQDYAVTEQHARFLASQDSAPSDPSRQFQL